MISTNHPFDITAPSTRRRVIVFELHNFFNAYTTPEDVLGGRMFESNWTEKDWLAYDNFMVECCEEYMRHGLIDLGEINYADNVLSSQLRPEVKSWLEEYLKQAFINKSLTLYEMTKMWDDFVKRYPDAYQARNSMTRDLKLLLRVKAIPSGIVRSTVDMLYLYPPKDQQKIEWIWRPNNKA